MGGKKMNRKETLELLEKERDIMENRVFAEKDGAIFVNFADAAVLNSVNAFDPKGTGMKTYNPDGSVASTGKTVHALNPDFFFMNRYKVKAKKLYIVSGHNPDAYLCIKRQITGVLPIKSIPCYVVGRNADGDLEFEKVITVSDSEFLTDFTSQLKPEAMAKVLPLIVEHGGEMTADELPI